MSHGTSSATSIPSVQQPVKLSCKARNDLLWDGFKHEIFQIYVKNDATLQVTMRKIEKRHGFTASERKWKMKLKEWGFDKYLPSQDMNILVAKAEKRKLDGKATTFLHNGNEIPDQRFETFKKRKVKQHEALDDNSYVSPGAATPSNITYHTPRADDFSEADIREFVPSVDPRPTTAARQQKTGGSPISRIDQLDLDVNRMQLDDSAKEHIDQAKHMYSNPFDLLDISRRHTSVMPEDLETSFTDSTYKPNIRPAPPMNPNHVFTPRLNSHHMLPNTSRRITPNSRSTTTLNSAQKFGTNEADHAFAVLPEPRVRFSSTHDQERPSLRDVEFICNAIRALKVTRDRGEPESAEKQLIRAISSSLILTTQQRKLVLDNLSFLIDENQLHFQKSKDQYSTVFAALVTACERNFAVEAPLTLRIRQAYIDQLMLKGDYLRAKVQIRKSLAVPQNLSGETPEARLQSGSSLSLCLLACGRKRRAIVTFVSSISQYLAGVAFSISAQLIWKRPGWDHSDIFEEGSSKYSIAKLIIGTTETIRTACIIQQCLSQKICTILLEAANTAEFASVHRQYLCAELLLREILRSINLLSYSWCRRAKVELFMAQSRNHQRQRLLHHSADNILDAYMIVADMSTDEAFLEMVDTVRGHWKKSEKKLVFRTLEGASTEEQKRDALSRSRVLNIKELDHVLRREMEETDDSDAESLDGGSSSRLTSSSCKFGVTYSEGSVSGIRTSDYVTYL